MNICLLNDSFPPVIDGVVNTVCNYASVLSDDYHENVMAAVPYYPGAGYDSYPYRVIPYPSLDTASLTGGYRAGYPFPVREIAEMAAFQPDVIHTHCPVSSCLIGRSLRDAVNAPLILTYHTKFDIDIRRSISSKFLQEESIRALVHHISACDEVWAVSEGAGRNLRELGYQGDYRIVRNGVDFPRGRVNDDLIHEVTAGYDLSEDVPVFLFVGRLMNYKGLPMIINALRELAETGDFRMVFIGTGADEKTLQDQIVDAGIAMDIYRDDDVVSVPGNGRGKIIFTGAVADRDKLRAWNCRADLFVFPSTFDTNGLVVREAAACGLASVLIRNSCAAEGITDGRNGYLIDENSVSLYRFLSYACSHRDEIREAGNKAMNEIYLSWHDAVKNALSLYEEAIEKRKRCPEKKKSFDDPLFAMTAEAALKCRDIMENEMPVYEGMMENITGYLKHLQK